MAEFRKMQNPARKGSSGKRKSATPKRRSNSLSKSRVVSFAKRNGMKLVPRSTANPKKKRRKHRRNGMTAKSYVSRARNGFLGNTKSDAKQVLGLGAGLFGTKAIGRVLESFAAPYLAQVGVGQYSEVISDAVVAIVVAPFVADKIAGKDVAKNVRLGGLMAVGVDLLEMFAPQALQFNPFNTAPIVLADGKPAIKPAVVAQIAQEVAGSNNPQGEANKVSGAMAALEGGADVRFAGSPSMRPVMLPLANE